MGELFDKMFIFLARAVSLQKPRRKIYEDQKELPSRLLAETELLEMGSGGTMIAKRVSTHVLKIENYIPM